MITLKPRNLLSWIKIGILIITIWFVILFFNNETDFDKTMEEEEKEFFLAALDRPSKVQRKIGFEFGDKSYGEMGKPVILPNNYSTEVKILIDDGWLKNGFNQYVSDLIPLNRSIPDCQDDWCKVPGRYLNNLPKTSIIICFHNEAWSVLLRTIHSVLNRSPPELIHEIILVDDFSDMPHLKLKLENYLKNYPKIQLIRASKREGLIRGRLIGTAAATAPILTFLDSHCECTEGWLEPLLDRIARNSSTVVCPVIDVINDNTFEYQGSKSTSISVGGFEWNLSFSWHALPEREKQKHQSPAEPVWSPTMAGGLFSINRQYFEKLGTYDRDFDVWGAENLELSFKIWMCGGTLEIVPCSHVGHVFRKRSPYKWKNGGNMLKRNNMRLSEVWLDDYSKYYYQQFGKERIDFGDVSERKALRKQLGCKSFKWYLDNIYPELFVPGDAIASGEVRNAGEGNRTCLDAPDKNTASLYSCHGQGGNQFWMFTKNGEIRHEVNCLDYTGKDILLYKCHGSKGNQLWNYDVETKNIKHGDYGNSCLTMSADKTKLFIEDCSPMNYNQKWLFEKYDPSKL